MKMNQRKMAFPKEKESQEIDGQNGQPHVRSDGQQKVRHQTKKEKRSIRIPAVALLKVRDSTTTTTPTSARRPSTNHTGSRREA
jgi:hypothetical protein